MNEPEVLPAPVLDLGPKNKWEREREAFYRLLPDLLQTHLDKYVAVHDERVVEAGDDKFAVARSAYGRFGYVPMYVSQVAVRPRVVHIYSPRLVKQDRP